MRISRACYDKPHRCPGWAGGGMRSAQVDRCTRGRIVVAPRGVECDDELFNGHPGAYPLRLGYCTGCDVVTLPVITRWLDPSWLRFAVRHKLRDVSSELRWKVLGR